MEDLGSQILLLYLTGIRNYMLRKFLKENPLHSLHSMHPSPFPSSLSFVSWLQLAKHELSESFWQINVFAENPHYRK